MGVALKAADGRSKPRWEGPIVPFVLSPNLTSRDRGNIAEALMQYEQASGLRFVARDDQDDYLELQIGQFFGSTKAGRQGGKQVVTLDAGFTRATVLHEVGRALGLLHEHQRPDRDDSSQSTRTGSPRARRRSTRSCRARRWS
jgi:hypothetical protein